MMRLGWHLGSSRTALLLFLLGSGGAAFAQAGRSWVDPPADLGGPATPAQPREQAAPPAAPVPAPPQAAPQQAMPPPEPTAPVQSARPNRPGPAAQEPAQSAHSPSPPPAAPAPSGAVARSAPASENRVEASERAARDLAVSYLASWSAPNQEALAATGGLYADRVVFHGRTMSVGSLVRAKRRFALRWPERDYRPQADTMKVACEPAGLVCTVHTVFDFMAANPRRGRRTEGVGALQLVVSFTSDRPIITSENSLVLSQGRSRPNLALEGASDE
jgi:hypothetical protein